MKDDKLRDRNLSEHQNLYKIKMLIINEYINSNEFSQILKRIPLILSNIDTKYSETFLFEKEMKYFNLLINYGFKHFSEVLFLLKSKNKTTFQFKNQGNTSFLNLLLIFSMILYDYSRENKDKAKSIYEKTKISYEGLNICFKNLIKFLYENHVISLSDICFVAKFMIQTQKENINLYEKNLEKYVFIFTVVIKIIIYISNSKRYKEEKQETLNEFIEDLLSLLKNHLNNNQNLYFSLSKRPLFFKLLNLSKYSFLISKDIEDKIIKFIGNFYSFQFDKSHFTFLINSFKNKILNIKDDNIIYTYLKNQLCALNTIISEEISIKKEQIKEAFIITDSNYSKNGFYIPSIELRKKFAFIFAFNFYGKKNKKEKSYIISFENEKEILSLYIDEECNLSLSSNNQKVIYTKEKIKIGKTYLIYLDYQKTYSNLCVNGDENYLKIKVPSKLKSTSFKIIFGYLMKDQGINFFNGKIGKILIYEAPITKQLTNFLNKINENYDLIQEIDSQNSLEELFLFLHKKTDIIKKIKDLRKKKVISLIKYSISPEYILNNFKIKKKLNFKIFVNQSLYRDNKNLKCPELCFQDCPIPENFGSFPVLSQNFVEQFLIFDGMSFLITIQEFLYHQITITKDKSDWEKINNILVEVTKLVFNVVNSSEITENGKEKFSNYFFSFAKIVFIVRNYIKFLYC